MQGAARGIEEILLYRRGLPLRRTWIEQPYSEAEREVMRVPTSVA